MEIKEPAVAYDKQKFTIEEYLQMERASDVKHEYYQGEIFAMAGASPRHSFISSNLITELHNRLKTSPCFPHGSDMRIHIPENTLFTYPGHLWKGEIYPPAYRCIGFQTTLIRATEWLATGKVNYPVPDDFPTKDSMSLGNEAEYINSK